MLKNFVSQGTLRLTGTDSTKVPVQQVDLGPARVPSHQYIIRCRISVPARVYGTGLTGGLWEPAEQGKQGGVLLLLVRERK